MHNPSHSDVQRILLTAEAIANSTTETEHEQILHSAFSGHTIDSCKRGRQHTDWIAWLDGDRRKWAAGKTREEAINDLVRVHVN